MSDGRSHVGSSHDSTKSKTRCRNTPEAIFLNLSHPHPETVEPRVTKFDRLTHQGRTINTHRPPHIHPQGVGPQKPKIVYMRNIYISVVGPYSTMYVILIDNNQALPHPYLEGWCLGPCRAY